MSRFQPFLTQHGFLVLDGGLATELERRGADLDHHLWSARLVVEDPERIIEVHRAYFEAGADVAISASYQATVDGFVAAGVSPEEAESLLVRTVELARTARERFWTATGRDSGRPHPLVAASVGPFGAVLHDGSEYRGAYGQTKNQLRDFHRPRLMRLAESGPDLLAIETIPSVLEAEVLCDLLSEVSDVEAWLSFVCRNDRETGEGQSIEEAAAVAEGQEAVVAVGVNCTAPGLVEEILHRMAAVTDKPLVAYPNSGEYWNATTRSWDWRGEERLNGATPREDWTTWTESWHAAGARLIGGCCRTTPETVETIAQTLASLGSHGTTDGSETRDDA